jgi:hypothetical protein
MKHLSRNKAWETLRELDDIASLKEIYAYCWEKGNVELILGAREYLWNRAEGRPFIAENPEAKAKPPGLTRRTTAEGHFRVDTQGQTGNQDRDVAVLIHCPQTP